MRKAELDPAGPKHRLEAEQALVGLEMAMAEAARIVAGTGQGARGEAGQASPAWHEAWDTLRSLEVGLHNEMRYLYGPDWEVKPGKLVSKKGTWLKTDTRFSWELKDGERLYLPHGVAMPVLQIGKVVDPEELKRHEWVGQHLRVWMKPAIVRTLEARRHQWFIYWPHFEDKGGLSIAALADTWLKRTTQMSGELQPFELIYVPKGLQLRLACEPSLVEEEWEKFRHQHVHLHRKVTLAAQPVTMKQDQYDIFVGQGEDKLLPFTR